MYYDKSKQAGRYGKAGKFERSLSTADDWFSLYTRLRDIIHVVSPTEAYCKCITCGKIIHYIKRHITDTQAAEAGHYMKRGKPATRYHEKNVHAQCKQCNRYKGGEEALYGLAIDRLYGRGTAEGLIHLSRMRGKKGFTGMALADISEKYRKMAYEMAERKGIDLNRVLYHNI